MSRQACGWLAVVGVCLSAVLLPSHGSRGQEVSQPAVGASVETPPALPFSGSFFRRGLFPRAADSTGRRWQVETRLPRSWITSLSWSPDGRRLAVAEGSGCVRIYETDEWRLVGLLYCEGGVETVAYSPDGKHLATVSDEKPNYGSGTKLRIWRADGTPVAETSAGAGMVSNVAWGPEGKRLATVDSYRTVLVFDLEAKQKMQLAGHRDTVRHIAWSPQGDEIASASRDGELRLWHLSRAVAIRIRRGGPAPPSLKPTRFSVPSTVLDGRRPLAAVRWMPRGRSLACVEQTGRVVLRGGDGEVHEIAEQLVGPSGVAPHRDGKRLAVCGGASIESIDIATGARRTLLASGAHCLEWHPRENRLAATDGRSVIVLDLDHHRQDVLAGADSSSSVVDRPIVWSPDGKQFTHASLTPWLRLWNADGRGVATSWKTQARMLWDVSWSSHGGLLATDGFADVPRLWKPDGIHVKAMSDFRGNLKQRFSPDGKLLAVVGNDGAFRFTDERGRLLALHREVGLHAFAWSPGSDLLAIAGRGNDGQVSLLNTAGRVVNTMAGKVNMVQDLDWHPLGRRLALIDNTGAVHRWDTAGADDRILGRHDKSGGAVAWSPSGEWLASSSVDIKIWNADGRLQTTIEQGENSLLGKLAWHPQGTWIAGQIFRSSIRLWKPNGEEGPTLHGGALAPDSMSWSPDGEQIVCATNDDRVLVWDAATGAPRWVGLEMDDGKSAVIDAAGTLHTDDAAAFDRQFVFVEYVDGRNVLKTSAQWRTGGR